MYPINVNGKKDFYKKITWSTYRLHTILSPICVIVFRPHRIIHFVLSMLPCIFSITSEVTSRWPRVPDRGCTLSMILMISLNTATTFQLYLALQSMYEHFHCLRIRLTISFSFSFCTSVLLLAWLFLCKQWQKLKLLKARRIYENGWMLCGRLFGCRITKGVFVRVSAA